MTHDPLLDACNRMWGAAHELDALRGDDRATDWLATHVRGLIRSEGAENIAHILALAVALEQHLPSPAPEAVAL